MAECMMHWFHKLFKKKNTSKILIRWIKPYQIWVHAPISVSLHEVWEPLGWITLHSELQANVS